MSKIKSLPMLLILVACQSVPPRCEHVIINETAARINLCFQGTLFESGNGVRVGIVKRVDPWDLNSFEYFTGSGFDRDQDKALMVPEKDSCDIKEKYLSYDKTTTNGE
jgi:hypothetical protein